MKKFSAIICAYNEEKTIWNVIESVFTSGVFNEIIVVNDGSTDNTRRVIQESKDTFQLLDIHLPSNKGKGYAMAVGLENSSAEFVVFCDAGLSNLNREHLLQVIQPLTDKEVDMVVGQAMKELNSYKVKSIKSFTGVAAIRKMDILPILDDLKVLKKGAYEFIKQYFQLMEKCVKYVSMEGLIHQPNLLKLSLHQQIVLKHH